MWAHRLVCLATALLIASAYAADFTGKVVGVANL